ncbi:MAG: hypothetical protein ACRD6N_03825, partial [Pyrinomonadaceae bacterium]
MRITPNLTTSVLKSSLVCCLLLPLTVSSFPFTSRSKDVYDLVILNGRVLDPESKLDALRNLGVSGGTIKVITGNQVNGRRVIDARGLIVSPGFIDLHQHGQDEENYRFKAMDG